MTDNSPEEVRDRLAEIEDEVKDWQYHGGKASNSIDVQDAEWLITELKAERQAHDDDLALLRAANKEIKVLECITYKGGHKWVSEGDGYKPCSNCAMELK